jgi:hypothetical protein
MTILRRRQIVAREKSNKIDPTRNSPARVVLESRARFGFAGCVRTTGSISRGSYERDALGDSAYVSS